MPVERNSGPRNLASKVMRGGLQKLPYHTSETTAGSETGTGSSESPDTIEMPHKQIIIVLGKR